MDLSLKKGDLAKFESDVLVNAADVSLRMSGGVAAALLKAGGREIEDEALEMAPVELGQAVATMAGKLNAKFVIHAASMKLYPRFEASTPESVALAVSNCLELADSLECETIAFPAIGCGKGGFGLADASRIILSKISSFSASNLKHAFIVLHSDEALSVFEKTAQELGIKQKEFVPPAQIVLSEEGSDSDSSAVEDGSDEVDSTEEKDESAA